MGTRSRLWFIAHGLILSGCVQSYYITNSHNVPLLTEKKEAHASIGYLSVTRELITSIPGFEVQGSYAVGKHIGVMGSFLHAARTIDNTYFRARYGDLGVGYYWANPSKHLVMECFGGYGRGYAENGFENNTLSSGDFSKWFIQPVLAFKSRYFDAALSIRWANVEHTSLHFYGTLPDWAQIDFDQLAAKPSYGVTEPAFTLRIGDQNMKAQLQTGYSVMNAYHSQGRFWTSVAVIVHFPFKKEEKKKQ